MRTEKIKAHHHMVKLMGCKFILTAIHQNPQIAWDGIRAAQQEIERIENLISSWKESSETSAINRKSGIQAVEVSNELFELISRSLSVSRITSGAFDISGTLSRYYWSFDKSSQEMLAKDQIDELCQLINYKAIELNAKSNTVFLTQQGMCIGFGGIGKGYAAQRAMETMKSMGIHSGLINASGDLSCWGQPPGEKEWQIKISHPDNNSKKPGGYLYTRRLTGNFRRLRTLLTH